MRSYSPTKPLIQTTAIMLLALAPSAARAKSPAEVYADKSPAVVVVYATGADKEGGSQGTGSIIRSDGYVLTNRHVVWDPRTERPYARIQLGLKPASGPVSQGRDVQEWLPARVVSIAPRWDLALLKVEAVGLPAIELGDPSDTAIGGQAFAIGHPGHGGLWTLTAGMISSRQRDYGGVRGWNVLQTNADINWGNSGGPLLDTEGRIIGVNTFIVRATTGRKVLTGINYAVDSETALRFLRRSGLPLKLVRQVSAPSPKAETPELEVEPKEPRPQRTPRPKKWRRLTRARPIDEAKLRASAFGEVRRHAKDAFDELEAMEQRMGR